MSFHNSRPKFYDPNQRSPHPGCLLLFYCHFREKLFLQTSGNCDEKAAEVEYHKSTENKKQDSNGAAVNSASASSMSNKDTHHPPFGVNDSLEANASLQLSPTLSSSLPHFREISCLFDFPGPCFQKVGP